MAYTIVKSDGTVLTTIADGTINTSSTSLGLPGRNYAGYGQSLDTNFVHVTENFADSTPPANPLRGQIWYDTSSTTLKVCPTDGESNALAWLSLTSTASGGNTTFGSVNITGNATANNFTATNEVTAKIKNIFMLEKPYTFKVKKSLLFLILIIYSILETKIINGNRFKIVLGT